MEDLPVCHRPTRFQQQIKGNLGFFLIWSGARVRFTWWLNEEDRHTISLVKLPENKQIVIHMYDGKRCKKSLKDS